MRKRIIELLNKNDGNISAAAKEARISRGNFCRFMRELKIDIQRREGQLVRR